MELKTDSCLFKPLKKKPVDLTEIRFRDLDTLRTQFSQAPRIKKLDSYCLMAPAPSDEPIFRVETATEPIWLRSVEAAPRGSGD